MVANTVMLYSLGSFFLQMKYTQKKKKSPMRNLALYICLYMVVQI
jgi:hypothetical protein